MSEAVLHRVEMPMRTAFDHPAARRRTSSSLVLRLTAGGVSGTGECAPRPYVTGESCDSVTEALRAVPMGALLARLEAAPARELLHLVLREGVGPAFGVTGGNNLLCLLETAVLDLLGNATGTGPGEWFSRPGGPRDTSPLPVSQVLDLSLDAEEFLATRGPFHFVKVKASGDLARDLRTVRTLREGLGAGVPLMVDANMSWSAEEAPGNARRLRAAGADHLEEPLAPRSWDALRALRRSTGIGVMLDESVCSAPDARTAIAAGACDALNIRVSKVGGLVPAAHLVALAREHGTAFQFGVQVAEVGPLINAGRALAFAHRDAMTVEAGQSDRFFPRMVVSPPPAVDRTANTLAPAPGPGLGLTLNSTARRWARLRHDGSGWRSAA